MSGLVRWRGVGQRHHPRHGLRRDWRLAGLAGLVAQQTLDPALGKTLLPPPYRRPADTDALRYPLRRVTIGRGEHNARPLDVLVRAVPVGRDRRQLLALHRAQYHAYRLSHGSFPQTWPSIAHLNDTVDPLYESKQSNRGIARIRVVAPVAVRGGLSPVTTSDLCLVLLSGAAAFAVFLGFTRYSVAELGTIDELPQIINVLRGDMSLIGPRPHAAMKAGKHLFSEAVKEYAQRHRVKPGITGWA